MPLFLGQLVRDRYRIDNTIARDDTGALYHAWDINLNTAVAVLENLSPDAAMREQFSAQADLLTRLSHSNLPRVLDHFTLPQQGQFLVMELQEGESLQQRLNSAGVLPQADALHWLAQLTDALAYLRRRPELAELPAFEPEDVLVRPDGWVTLMGFRLFKEHMPGQRMRSYERGINPGFSAPELYGNSPADERAIVYTLGAILYFLLTNQQPPDSIQLATGSAKLLPPARLNPAVTPPVEQLIYKAMAPDAGRRYQSLEALRLQLQSVKLEPDTLAVSAPAAAEPPAGGKIGRFWPVVLGGLGFVLGAILVSVVYVSFLGDASPAETGVAAVAPTVARQMPPTPAGTPLATNTPAALVEFPTATPESLTLEAADEPLLPAAPPLETEAGEPVELVREPLTGAAMVLVPAGPFVMGGLSGGNDSLPAHTVSLPDFYIDQHEVTNARYRACVQAGACLPPGNTSSYTRRDYFEDPQFDDYPVLQVSWEQAFTFCAWREARLPTEAEWEKAARGENERTFPWGEGIDCSTANWATASGVCVGDTTAVGSYPAGGSPYGVMDMAGNVWEWVADWYAADYYAASPEENPQGPEDGELKVLRGGSWVSNETNVRAAFRNNLEPASASSNIGFRCASSGRP